ncbi:LEA type 2 family protein [Halomarina rubra]|uniref:LEA type 2 family protein n=1 Tax=Halomarina rubra TaxID=2071873 RepID=A0ABD6AQS8_9EURY|nr:LEA type 2 family protein [Halomarina rubra]
MSIRGKLFGRKVRAVLAVVVLLVASVAGAYVLGVVGAPAVTDVENRFGAVDENETTIQTDLALQNPNPVGVQLGGASVAYTVYMNDVDMAEGGREGVSVPKGDSSMAFTTQMNNERIPAWWVSHIENGERTEVNIDASVHSSLLGRSFDLPQRRTIQTDIIEQFRSTEDRPVNANRPLVSDPVLVVRETNASWGDVSERRTPIDMSFTVYNPKTVPYAVTEIGYNITMNDVAVGNGTTDEGYVIPGGTEKTLRATTAIDNQRLDEWWVTHLQNDQQTELQIDFFARIELPSGSTIRVPLDALTYTKTIETDIFGTKNATAADGTAEPTATGGDGTTTTEPAGDDSTPTASATATDDDGGLLGAGETETPTDGEATSAPTPTPDRTATPTATPTDGGGGLLGGGSNDTTSDGRTTDGPTDGTPSDDGTETDDGGLLGALRGAATHGMFNPLVA